MLAGHILLVTFGVLCISLWQQSALVAVLPFSFATLVVLTAFEMMVSVLQAFVFACSTAVYISCRCTPPTDSGDSGIGFGAEIAGSPRPDIPPTLHLLASGQDSPASQPSEGL